MLFSCFTQISGSYHRLNFVKFRDIAHLSILKKSTDRELKHFQWGREILPPSLLAHPSRFAFRVSPFPFPFKRLPRRLSQTPLYRHPLNVDISLSRTICSVPGEESPYISSKFNLLNTDTPLIRILSIAPSVSVLTEFDCPWKGNKLPQSRYWRRTRSYLLEEILEAWFPL